MAISVPSGSPKGSGCAATGAGATLFRKQVVENLNVCPECDHHFPITAWDRVAQLLDADTFEEWHADLRPGDPLGFNDRRPYPERVKAEQDRTGLTEGRHHRSGVHQGPSPGFLRHR